MTEPTVHRCTAAGCIRFTTHQLCALHRTPQPEVAPEHQSHAERAACVDLASPGRVGGHVEVKNV